MYRSLSPVERPLSEVDLVVRGTDEHRRNDKCLYHEVQHITTSLNLPFPPLSGYLPSELAIFAILLVDEYCFIPPGSTCSFLTP
jgi:hypothetical protein